MFFYEGFRITGGANAIKYADGLQSTVAEPKRLVAVGIQVADYGATADNDVKVYHERAEILSIPETMFGQHAVAVALEQVGSERLTEVPIGLDIPTGEAVKVALKCAANEVNLRGYYKYELIA